MVYWLCVICIYYTREDAQEEKNRKKKRKGKRKRKGKEEKRVS